MSAHRRKLAIARPLDDNYEAVLAAVRRRFADLTARRLRARLFPTTTDLFHVLASPKASGKEHMRDAAGSWSGTARRSRLDDGRAQPPDPEHAGPTPPSRLASTVAKAPIVGVFSRGDVGVPKTGKWDHLAVTPRPRSIQALCIGLADRAEKQDFRRSPRPRH
jgi:hypothetical protein